MMHVLDIRDSLDADRFVQIHFDPAMNRIVMKEAKIVQAEGKDDLPPNYTDMMMGTYIYTYLYEHLHGCICI
jgi:hypothetical protein